MNNMRNKVQLMGKLGKDPELKRLKNGSLVAKITLVTREVYHNASGEKVVETQWHKCVAWGNTAESIEVFLKKGNEVAVQGKLLQNKYRTRKGEMRNETEVLITEFMLLANATAISA